MKRIKLVLWVITLVNILIFVSSCKKLIQVGLPPNQVAAGDVFSDSSLAVAASLNMYVNLTMFEPYFAPLMGLYVDELNNINGGSDGPVFFSSILSSDNTTAGNAWMYLYNTIYQSNAIIEGMNGNSSISPMLKNRLIGEADFCRAYSYFYLVNLYGDVPLVLTTDVTVTATVSRTPSDKVYSQVIADLQASETLLLGSYTGEEKVRATKWAAAALLARVYLYTKDYSAADSAASAVINSNTFSLGSIGQAFGKNSTEAILELYNQNGYTLGASFIPASNTTAPNYSMDAGLLALFDSADLRSQWIGSSTANGLVYYYPLKYEATSTSSDPNGPEYYILLRLSEQYLIRSEAKENENDIPDAVSDLNIVHTRADLQPITKNILASQCDSLIQKERRLELFTENFHRFMDLKRSGTINQVMSILKASTWVATADFFPIPKSEILVNPNLSQNPGYH